MLLQLCFNKKEMMCYFLPTEKTNIVRGGVSSLKFCRHKNCIGIFEYIVILKIHR